MKTLAITLILILSQVALAQSVFDPLLPPRVKVIDDYLENNKIEPYATDVEDYINNLAYFTT